MITVEQELEFGKEQMLRRNEEYESAVEAMAKAHREAENGRLSAIQELEKRKYDITDLESRLDNAEQRLNQLHEDYIRADNDRELLKDALKRFRASISQIYGKPIREEGEEIEFKSVPLPPAPIDFSIGTGSGGIDSDQLDHSLQDLANRIENLQRERVNRLK